MCAAFCAGTMFQGIYNSAASADALQKWSDVVARNIGTGPIPGFKKDMVSFDSVAMGTIGFGGEGKAGEQMPAFLPVPRGSFNFSAGKLEYNREPKSFAIEGEGFFKIQRPDGTALYTRDGQFGVSSTGQLVNKQGLPVMGETGPIQLLIDGGEITADSDGRLFQGDQQVGVVSIYDVSDRSALRRASGGFVLADDRANDVDEIPIEGGRVRQGYLETTNVSAISEMIDLVTITNALQANQKVIQTYDGLSDRAIQSLSPTA
jgi:flagellar basal-body rod protein FlgF